MWILSNYCQYARFPQKGHLLIQNTFPMAMSTAPTYVSVSTIT